MFLNIKAHLRVFSQNILCMASKILMESYLMTTAMAAFLLPHQSNWARAQFNQISARLNPTNRQVHAMILQGAFIFEDNVLIGLKSNNPFLLFTPAWPTASIYTFTFLQNDPTHARGVARVISFAQPHFTFHVLQPTSHFNWARAQFLKPASIHLLMPYLQPTFQLGFPPLIHSRREYAVWVSRFFNNPLSL